MGLVGRFANPENHVPTLEEMRHAYARKHGSLLEKVSVLQPGTLLRFIIGENVFQLIRDSALNSELLNLVRVIKEKHNTVKLDLIAERCFPKFHENDNASIESYALKEPSLTSFMNGVLNYIIPKDLLSSKQRTLLITFISGRLTTWRWGTSLLASNESYPSLKYVVIEKEVKKNLEKIWALCNNDKYVAEELLDAISTGLTHFSALYALHSLSSSAQKSILILRQLRVKSVLQLHSNLDNDDIPTQLTTWTVASGTPGDFARFYYIPTYNMIKEQCQKIDKTEMAFSRCSTSTEEYRIQGQGGTSIQGKESESFIVQKNADANSNQAHTQGTLESNSEAQLGDIKGHLESFTVLKNVPSEDSIRGVGPLPLKRVKLELPGPIPKMFPRDRPPDDIPVYDYTKIKREKFDVKLAQMETESRASNCSSSNHLSGSASAPIDEWDEVLRSINADPAVPAQYKIMFRCLVMSNRDLRDHNKILRSQLEKR